MADLNFAHLVDIEQIRELLEAHFKITGIGAGILDANENILVAVGYQDICTRFHLVHPVTKLYCRESDAFIKAHLSTCSEGYLDYRCKNGLVDIAVPIMIDGRHFATFFTGQFFYDDDKPDVGYFRKQAEKFGFDEAEYLEALDRVPVFSRDRIRKTVEYYLTLVKIIAGMGIRNLELRREAAELNEAKEALLISRFCIDKAGIGIYRTDEGGTIFSVNDHACKCLGYAEDELLALSIFDIDPVITRERMIELKEILDAAGSVTHESIHRRKDGTTFPVEITANLLEFDGKTYGISFVKDITERKQVEKELLLTQHCVDKASIAIHRVHRGGRISHANEQMCRNLGYTRAELSSMSVFDFDPAITPEKLLEVERLARENGSRTFESVHRRKNGTSLPVEITVNYWNVNGHKLGMAFVQDITERKQAEEALLLSQYCIDKAGVGVYRCDETGMIFSVNEQACKSLGYTRDELCALSVYDIDPAITPEQMRKLQETLDERETTTFHTTHLRKDGTTFPVEITINYINFQGKKYGICFVKDITERKRSEEELRLTQFCVDKASIALYQVTEEGEIWNVNEYACQSLGYSMEELRSMTVFDIDAAATKEVFSDLVNRMLSCGSITFERTHRRKDGTIFPVEITANFLEFGGRKCGICFVKDIAERKQAEEAFRESEARVRLKLESILDPEGDIGELDLADIIDAPQIQALVNDLYRNTGVKMSIIDLKGKVLVDAGWQEICLNYHRGHPETRERCRESDTVMTEGVPQGEFRTYKCGNNMWHMVTPIFVGGKHMGNLFMGQFFFENEELDYGLFRSQARKYGFPEDEYIAALEAVPRHSEECVNKGKAFFLRLIEMFSRLSYGNIKLARLLAERDRLAAALRKAHDELESKVRERTGQLSAITYELSIAEERERRRIAGELHDQVGQSLILSKLKLDSISPSLSPGELEALLSEIRGHLGKSIENTRSLTFQLSPPLLYEVGFEAAVEWLADEFEEKFGLMVNFQDDKKPKPLDEKGSIILYQMVRELLINVAKHAEAGRVNINIAKIRDKIRVIVADDGKGIDPEMNMHKVPRNGSFGLFNIRHRIEHLGGSLEIESEVGRGTRISLYLSLRKGNGSGKRGGMNGNQDHTGR